MSLDALFLKCLLPELQSSLTEAKIEKINMPARGTVVMTVKGERRQNLLIGGSSGAPRIHFTEAEPERPQEPPMFCMLLRKHLVGARILDISQPATDRVLTVRLAAPGMFGEGEERGLAVELMGRTANLILTDKEGIITDCLYRVGSAEEKRALIPGMRYALPPMQEKLDLLKMTDGEIATAVGGFDGGRELDRCVLAAFLGVSPLIARELCERSYGDTSPAVSLCRERDGLSAICRELSWLRDTVNNGLSAPYLIRGRDGEPMDFAYIPVTQYGSDCEAVKFDSFSKLLDDFYTGRDAAERRRQRARELTKTVKTAAERTERRLEAQRRELADTENRDWLRQCGDIITANLYSMKKGQRELTAEDFYLGGERKIPLDPLKTPQQNAAKYYKDYNRAKSARAHLTERVEAGEGELEYLKSVLEELERAEDERDLGEIRSELTEGGYVRDMSKGKKPKRQPSQPMLFRSSSGLIIRAGRNNAQNDRLTLKDSAKSDLWLHAGKMPGSHVVIACEGREPDERTVNEAAAIAAYYSQGRSSTRVPIDVTPIREIKKPVGARPGMVIYHTYRTLTAEPDEALVERLRIK